MIEWKKYDPFNPPDPIDECLLTDGVNTSIGQHSGRVYVDGWFSNHGTWRMYSNEVDPNDVTHYCEINLPKDDSK